MTVFKVTFSDESTQRYEGVFNIRENAVLVIKYDNKKVYYSPNAWVRVDVDKGDEE
ncbi:hypothetical protein [Rhodococcus pyridinivorans]|uniref:hypothetical protein n=1 Tax=Rhodococcus pyridinivorans TaxID=103816 RepID=UPI0002FE042E|nr:hypothetical protein [Rhodococcus pyridinivorans]MCD2140400.1 hypothetical protein [Rhodococcus pyridinivorans]